MGEKDHGPEYAGSFFVSESISEVLFSHIFSFFLSYFTGQI